MANSTINGKQPPVNQANNIAARLALDKSKLDVVKLAILQDPENPKEEELLLSYDFVKNYAYVPEYLSRGLVLHSAVVERETRTYGLCSFVSDAATTIGQMSFAIGGVRLWNSLPLGLREGFQRPGFDAGLRRYLLDLQSGS
ncbi:hypothetical protein TKK_0011596 [Trichogramma kaykai]